LKKYFAFLAVLLASIACVQIIYATEVFFEHTTVQIPTRGVEYERTLQMTGVGLREVHILRIPLDDPYITIAPVASQQSVGRRESTSALLSAVGAVAGVNADFFHMTTNYAVHLGPMVYNGQLLAAHTETNRYQNSLATFFLDTNNNPFFDYLRIDVHLYHHGARNLRINHFNNIGNTLEEPMVFTYTAMSDTSALDARFPNTIKVVSNGTEVIQRSLIGETVEIPEGGFVVVFPANMAGQHSRYWVGDSLHLSISNNLYIDFSLIQSGVGGGGMLLIRGETAEDGGYVTTGRQPRSAVGYSRDGQTLILMVVDGRGASVGASHFELAELMRNAGAYHAMHFDGGGSATMVVRENERYSVVNTPSEGSQRRVVNALGVFDTAKPGEPTGIALEMARQRVAVGTPVASRVYARDASGFRFPMVEGADLTYMVLDRTSGFWQDGYYTPLTAGAHTVHVWQNHLWSSQTIYAVDIAELHTAPVSLLAGENQRLVFLGTAVDGSTLTDVHVNNFRVVPTSLGRVEGGYFHAANEGVGYIRVTLGNVTANIPVSVGRASEPVNMRVDFMFSGYPDFVEGDVQISQVSSHLIPRLSYSIVPSTETQAAHMVFDPPLVLPVTPDEVPVALRLQVHGDGSGHWLRGRVRDGNGVSHNIDFTRNADFEGWQNVTAHLPANAPGPFVLERLWMAVLEAGEASEHAVYFYNLQTLYAPPSLPEVPRGTSFADPLRTHGEFTGIPGGGSHAFDVNFGTAAYRFSHVDDMAIMRLAANNAGLTDRRQWERILQDVLAADAAFVVVLINVNPMGFPPLMFELFHELMRSFLDEGRTVFVVSPSPDSNEGSLTLRDGVRYIKAVDEIRFFTDGDKIWWYA
jgi:hypothetical protein